MFMFRDLTNNYGSSNSVAREFEISFIDLF
jgi:hypothetical protein